MLVYTMADGRTTTDVDQAIRWLAAKGQLAQDLRQADAASREADRVFGAAIAKFEGKDVD